MQDRQIHQWNRPQSSEAVHERIYGDLVCQRKCKPQPGENDYSTNGV